MTQKTWELRDEFSLLRFSVELPNYSDQSYFCLKGNESAKRFYEMNSKEEQLYCVFEKEFLLINQNIKVFIYKDDIMFIGIPCRR